MKKDYTDAGNRGFSLFIYLFIYLFKWLSHVCGNSEAMLHAFIVKASSEIHRSYSSSWAQIFMFCLYYWFSQVETGEGQWKPSSVLRSYSYQKKIEEGVDQQKGFFSEADIMCLLT